MNTKSTNRFSLLQPLESRQMMSASDIDLTFGNRGDGTVVEAEANVVASAMKLDYDGKIYVAATVKGPSGNNDMAIYRFLGDGSLDTTFGPAHNGKVEFTDGTNITAANLAVSPYDGSIWEIGTRTYPSGHTQMVMSRCNSGGMPSVFGFSQFLTSSNYFWGTGVQDTVGTNVLINNKGEVFMCGSGQGTWLLKNEDNYGFREQYAAVAKFKPTGAIDNKFGVFPNNDMPTGTVEKTIRPHGEWLDDHDPSKNFVSAYTLAADGSLYFTGESNGQAMVGHIFADGSNGDNGMDGEEASVQMGNTSAGLGITTDSQGNVIVVGRAQFNGDGASSPLLERFSQNTLNVDYGFNSAFVGKLMKNGAEGSAATFTDVKVDDAGRINVIGDYHERLLEGRFTADGKVDKTFVPVGAFTSTKMQLGQHSVHGFGVTKSGRLLQVTDTIARGDFKHHIGMTQWQGTPVTPAAPTNLAVAATGPGTVRLAWQDNTGVETGYVIDVCQSNFQSGWYVQHVYVPANTTMKQIDGLQGNTKYWFRVRADNVAGPNNTAQSWNSNMVTATPLPKTPVAVPPKKSAAAGRMIDLLDV